MLSGLRRLFGSPAASPPSTPSGAADGVLVNAYATVRELPPLAFGHTLVARRDRRDPALAPHLQGFAGYVQSTGDGTMTQAIWHLRGHIARVRHQVSFNVGDGQLDAMAHWADAANAVLFLPDGSVRDPRGRVLASRGAPPVDPQAALPFPADAQARKERSTALLASHELRVTPHLPPVAGETEAVLRSPAEVLGRAQALLVVAVRAESLHAGDPLTRATLRQRLPAAFEHLSPDEKAFLAQDQPEAADVVRFAWRYEAANLLEWALGLRADLPFPATTCDAAEATRAMIAHGHATPVLRSTTEILDALDLTLRLHWITRQAQVDGKLPVAGVDAGVVQERHQALNWLADGQGDAWDDVDTPT